MQVDEWTGRGVGMSLADQVGEKQFDERTSGVTGMSSVYRVMLIVRVCEMSTTDRVGEMQFDRMMG